MLTVAPHLRTRRPSPTTVEYTVSTSPPLTLPLRLLILLNFLIRITIGISVLLILYSKYLLSTELPTPTPQAPVLPIPHLQTLLSTLHTSRAFALSTLLAQSTHFLILLPLSLIILHILTLRLYTTESLLILRGLGIQTSTSSSTYLSTATTRFIPTEKIQDILVNEAFKGWEVRYYLIVVVQGEESVVVVFPRLLPSRGIVETVWRGCRGVLWEPGDRCAKEGGRRERKKSAAES